MAYNVVFICDDNFVLPTGVAIYSLFVNKDKKSQYNIWILGNQLTEVSKASLLELNKDSNFNVQVVDISDCQKYDNLSDLKGLHVSTTSLYKFDLANVFSDLDRILYLDGDIIIKKDLASLFDTDISEVYAAVVEDRHGYFYKNQNFKERLGCDNEGYFNTGVMLLNLRKIREDNIPEKLVEYRRTGKNDFMDQDAFNVVIGGEVLYLPFLYNVIATCVRYSDIEHLNIFYPQVKQESLEDLLENCYIYHYASPEKPWKNTNCRYGEAWEKYYHDSPFQNTILERTYANKKREEEYTRIQNIIGINSENVKISIIIPIYNAEKYLQQCLDSICKQKFIEEIEVICVDDGSTDNSSFILNKYALSDPRIKILYQENQGPGVARNKGIEMASAGWVTFIDADDMLASGEVLKEVCDMTLEGKADIIMCAARLFSNEGVFGRCNWVYESKYLPNQKYFNPAVLKENIYTTFGGNPWAKVFRKEFIVANSLKFLPLPRSEDFFFVQLALTLASTIGILNKELISHRKETGTNLEATKDETPLAFWKADKYFHEQLSTLDLEEYYKASAKIRSLVRLDYNLGAMKTYDGYKKIYETAKTDIYPYLCPNNEIIKARELGSRESRLKSFAESNSAGEYLYQLFLEQKNRRADLANALDLERRFIQAGKAQSSARIDVKLFGETADFELQDISDIQASVTIPGWFQDGGKGYQIETFSEKLNLSFIVKTDGKLTISLKGKDVRDVDGIKRISYWINYNMLTYNGVTEFAEAKYAWHDNPITISHEVKAGETVNLHIEWKPCKMQDPELPKRLKDTEKKLKASLSREASLKKSVSFRTGRAITWFPRKVRGGVRCLKEHGPAYTVKRFFWHITH